MPSVSQDATISSHRDCGVLWTSAIVVSARDTKVLSPSPNRGGEPLPEQLLLGGYG